MPQGMYYRRGHWVKKSKRKQKTSGWVVLAVVLAVGWLFTHSSSSSAQTPATKPGVAASASASGR